MNKNKQKYRILEHSILFGINETLLDFIIVNFFCRRCFLSFHLISSCIEEYAFGPTNASEHFFLRKSQL